jgi:hypothetical protein
VSHLTTRPNDPSLVRIPDFPHQIGGNPLLAAVHQQNDPVIFHPKCDLSGEKDHIVPLLNIITPPAFTKH